MRMLRLNEQHLHLNNVMLMLTTVEQRDMLSADHQWNVSANLQRRINTLVHHIDHSKNGFVISLERLTQQTTLDSLISTIDEIELELLHTSQNQQLAQALKVITVGLKSLEYFKNQGLFEVKYKFRELIRNVDSIRTLVETQLQLEPALVDIILGSTFDFTETVAREQVDPLLLCNHEALKSIIQFNENDEALSDYNQNAVFDMTANAICVLSTSEGYLFSDSVLRTFAIKKIVNNMLDIISNGVLENRNIKRQEVPNAMSGLKIATSSMHRVKPFLDRFKELLDLEQYQMNTNGSAIDLLGSSQSGLIASRVMCGRDHLLAIRNELHLLKSTIKNPKIDQTELESMKSEFCKNSYRQIIQMNGGALIWTWLKPILSGKILYTPKNFATDQIINEINSTFKSLESLINSFKIWTETVHNLKNFFDDKSIKQKIVDAQTLLPLVLGQGYEHLFDDSETLNQIENLAQSRGIINLIELFGDIAQCIELNNRFIGYDTEFQLEQAAKRYTKSHNLIAGLVFLNLNAEQYNYFNLNKKHSNKAKSPTLPKRIKYKLRIDIDFVPTTKQLKDRIWLPGPKDHFDKDLGYFKGFVQLQELVDRAIMKVQLKNLEFTKLQSRANLLNNLSTNTVETEFNFEDFKPINDDQLLNLDLPSVYMQQMPYSCYKEDKFGFYILALSPVISTVAWIFLIAFSIRDYVLERELHLEEILYVTGLKSSIRFIIWFILAFSIMAFGCACGLAIFRLADIIPNSDFTLVYLYFLAFCFSIVMYCYMMTSFFRTATIASLSGIIVYLASFLPFMIDITLEHQLTLFNKLFSCLSMSTGFCFGIMYLARFEAQGVGVQWSNIYQSPMSEDTMNFAYAGFAMIFDGFLYFIIGWYFSNVLATTNYGRKNFYFFLLPSYWGFCTGSSKSNDRYANEKVSSNHQGISVHNLCVTYNKGNKKKEHKAVSDLTMSLEEGQIATLLGKNGAGKTTTISVLTGILKPTSGSIYFYGNEFLRNFERSRKLLGYCPQYNVLFDRLTVREHLDFFARLKNLLPEKEIKADVQSMLKSTGLVEVQNELAMNLSGGLQRRLCVAIAFIGGSKMIILDEPTASVDPMARRKIHDLIAENKSTRTVLLSTHHMEEADVLSDEVMIIHEGKLLCHGSPLLLKNKYGCGYQLTISRFGDASASSFKNNNDNTHRLNEDIKIMVTDYDKENREEETALDQLNVTDSDSGRVSNNSIHLNGKRETSFNNCKLPSKAAYQNDELIKNSSDKLMQFIRCLIPNATKLDENLNEMIVALPRTGADGHVHDYSTFFQSLDSNISRFGYQSYGLTSTTLEEVFLTLVCLQDSRFDFVGSLENKLNLAKKINISTNSFYNGDMNNDFDYYNDRYNSTKNYKTTNDLICSGLELKIMQFRGLIKKRAYHTFTNWRTLFYNLIFPCIFICFSMGMTTIKPTLAPDLILPLNPAIHGSETTSFYVYRHFDRMRLNEKMNITNLDQISRFLLKKFPSEYESPAAYRQKDEDLECAEPRKGWKVSKCPVVKKSFQTEFPQYLLNFTNSKDALPNNCECEQCFNYTGNINLPTLTSTGYVYDLSNVSNINHFLMKTFTLFNERRYGGWSLHRLNGEDQQVHEKNNEVWKVWFDNNGQHAIPSYLNTLDNAVFRANLIKIAGLSEEEALHYSINSYSHPFHIRSAQLGDQNLMQKSGDTGIALILLVGFVFIPTSFVFYIVKERKNEEKHMQRIFGVGTTLYWSVAIVWDMIIVFFSVIVAGAIIWSFQMPIYTTRLNFPAIMLLLLLFGWAMISVVYTLEKFFDEASIAFMVIYCLALFVGINTMVFRLLIDVFNLLQVSPTFKMTFERIALIFPPFALMSGLVDITKNHLLSEMFQLVNQDVYMNPFSMDLLAPHYITLAIEGVVLFIFNLIIELFRNGDLWFLSKHFTSNNLNASDLLSALDPVVNSNSYAALYGKKEKLNLGFEEDQDVFEERKRIITSELNSNHASNYYQDNDVLKVVNVTKKFNSPVSGGKDKIVVDKVSFGVPPGECFGLLGTNGAGKTTLFKILTGQLSPSSGATMFNQQRVEKVLAGTCKILGYCPQADALDSTLTPRQHLAIYALIRGIKRNQREKMIKDSLMKFQLNQYEHFSVHTLSRGTKRKLCLAISMLGDPQIVLLDEPTSGVDAVSRRCLWGAIRNVIKERRSVLNTSHSMEECDILCSRIAIMVNGTIGCLGSPQYLKRKYGYGYTISLRLNENMLNYNKAIDFMKKHFPTILMRAHHNNMLEFSLPTNDMLLSTIFSSLDTAKVTLNLQDYTISQTTLDQVFVNFANHESQDSLASRKRNIEAQHLPFLDDLKSRINELQINETGLYEPRTQYAESRIDESQFLSNSELRGRELRNNNEELMQRKQSNLMKSSCVYSSNSFGQLHTYQLNVKPNRRHSSSGVISTSPNKKIHRGQLNQQLPIQAALNHQMNASSIYFNPTTAQLTNNYKNYSQSISYPPNCMNTHTTNLYNTVQQSYILPKAKRKK